MEADSALRQLLAIAGREIEDDECWERADIDDSERTAG
jgi:hypothetical protein